MPQETPFKISWQIKLPNLETTRIVADTSQEQYEKCKENLHALFAFIMRKQGCIEKPVRDLRDLDIFHVSFQNGEAIEREFTLT
ncbi:MAG: hypothetical protein KBC22_01470 [Candidatus Pacebacteria bacterium]|nr:hypothetical protein [Candidatus Paceibacterota bacterium]